MAHMINAVPIEQVIYLDVIKVGSRYQIVDTRTNSPVGKTLATRRDAHDAIYELDAEAIMKGHGQGTVEAAKDRPRETRVS